MTGNNLHKDRQTERQSLILNVDECIQMYKSDFTAVSPGVNEWDKVVDFVGVRLELSPSTKSQPPAIRIQSFKHVFVHWGRRGGKDCLCVIVYFFIGVVFVAMATDRWFGTLKWWQRRLLHYSVGVRFDKSCVFCCCCLFSL